MNNLSEQFQLQQKAKRLEKIGNSSEALKVYLELHENYRPNTFDSFERPIVLLEKYKRYNEAIEMCEKAIQLVKEGKISGTVDQFESRLERLIVKNGGKAKHPSATKEKNIQK